MSPIWTPSPSAPAISDVAEKLDIQSRLKVAKAKLEWVSGSAYLQSLRGTIGADPMGKGVRDVRAVPSASIMM